MKLVLYNTPQMYFPHLKNYDGMQRMCHAYGIQFEHTRDEERTYQDNYDILIAYDKFIDPDKVPKRIKIIYGPGFFTFPSGPIVGPTRDDLVGRCAFNTLSEWNKQVYIDIASSLVVPIECFPYGVETDYFYPESNIEKEYDCILYVKSRPIELVEYTKAILEQKGLRYKIFKYGSYNGSDFLHTLKRTKFMVVLDAHESQGFALQEAMSCNVPLLVFDIESMYDDMPDGVTHTYTQEKHGPYLLLATTVPYWSDECGILIHNKEELSQSIDKMTKIYNTFTPRDYVLRTLSNEVCMKRILDYFNLTPPKQ
jgi:hypothetical protein